MPRNLSGIEQTIAVIGVIVSLLFVGYEIRQNTQVARAAAVQATSDQIMEWQNAAAHDEEWLRVITFLRSGGSFGDLSDLDKQRYQWVVNPTVRIMENRYRQMQLGVIDPEDMGAVGGTSNPYWFRSPHFLAWWQASDQTKSWAPDFLEFFETEVLGLQRSGP